MESLPQRKHPLAECENCPLIENRVCHTTGPADAKIAFVSRSPGRHDVRMDRPFAGPSGKVLDHLLKINGKERNDIITTNVVLCQSDDPPVAAIKACKARLEHEIANCELIIAGGTEATSATSRYRAVHSARGFSISRRSSVSGKQQRVVVTNNPAAVIRDSDKYPDMVADFKRALNPPPPPIFPEVTIVDDPTRAKSIFTKWLRTDFEYLASDLEWHNHRIECAGFSANGSKAVVFSSNALEQRTVRQLLKRFYERSDIRFIWHNGKADTTILRHNDIRGRIDEDTFLQSYALDERPGYHSLEYLLSSEFGWPDYEPESVKHFKRTGEFKEPVNRSKHELYKYNGWDTAGTLQLHNVLNDRLDADGVRELYEKYLLPTAEAIKEVEMFGFNFDVNAACDINEAEAIPRLWELEEELRKISGRSLLNPRSNQQMHAIYYGQYELKHGLRDLGKKKLSSSTGAEVRKEIEDGRFTCASGKQKSLVAFAAIHSKWKKIETVQSRYLKGLSIRTQVDGKIYCNFNIGGTVTGRPSSNDPNLQNVIREEIESIPGIRTLFLPSKDSVIISADYSQAELRTCAKLSGDKALLSIYRDSSRSLHKERAAAFYGNNYTKEEYVKSKNINFGVTYGQSAKAFAQMYHMPEKEAQNYINTWWSEFTQLKVWVNETQRRALKEGYVQSPFGHKRRFHLITDENIGDLQREAVNFKPQNIAAWLTLCSLVDLVNLGVRIVATVHDSLVADVPKNKVKETAFLMKSVMVQQPIKQLGWQRDDIPFEVDISIGPNWGTLEEIQVKEAA